MAAAVLEQQWDQTAVLWVTIANAYRDQKKRVTPFSVYDIHPFREPPAEDGCRWSGWDSLRRAMNE
jgi:hypothetical protein